MSKRSSFAVAAEQVTTIKLGMDINYPPYAFKSEDGQLAGFAVDFARGMNAECPNINIELLEVTWNDCWQDADGGNIGSAIEDGTVDGCMTYIHTHVRDDRAEFSGAMLDDNKAAGLLTLLDEYGNPIVSGIDDLESKTLIDVDGWAPSGDALQYVTNQCTNSKYSTNITVLPAGVDETNSNPNDVAMQMLRNGEGDAIFMMADLAEYYAECPTNDILNCTLWEGFGTSHAYVQTGQFGYVKNGTTFAIAKKGSGIRSKLSSCMSTYMTSKQYYQICSKYDIVEKCYKNDYFDEDGRIKYIYDRPTSDQLGSCDNGYCPCNAAVTAEVKVVSDENGGDGLALPIWAIVVIVVGSVLSIAMLTWGYKTYQRRIERVREDQQVQDLKNRVMSSTIASGVAQRGSRVSQSNEQQSQASGTQASGTVDVAETISTGTIAFAKV